MRAIFSAIILLSALFGARGYAAPLEAYGELPTMRSVAISPDGERIAYLTRQDGEEALVVFSLRTGESSAARIENIKARTVSFATPNHVILRVSETTSVYGYRDQFEYSGAFSFNVAAGKVRRLLRGSDDLYPAQSGLGRIVGVNAEGTHAFMPAFVGQTRNPPNALMKVNLDTGLARVFKRGRPATIDWIVDAQGEPIAREDFDDNSNVYSIFSYVDGSPKEIYREKTDRPTLGLVGVKSDKSALIISKRSKKEGFLGLYELSFEGELSDKIHDRSDADVASVVTDPNRVIYGVEFSGMYPTYIFFEDDVADALVQVESLDPGAAVTLADWTPDFRQLVLHVAGGASAPTYFVLDRDQNNLLRVASTYDLDDGEVSPAMAIEYKARDGATIPAVLTRPRDFEEADGAPAIILPHGGPESYDRVGFDWMAQYFAARGFVVMQPNFRGSTGFGTAHRDAGRGQWGVGVMQHDVSDSVDALVKMGWVDPSRICIVGASYGGYAALAGGAFTPALYACIVAIAPVTDLPRMLLSEERRRGRRSWVVDYWEDLIGDLDEERARLEAISPRNNADSFRAPVLLLHGDDDTVVPIDQSRQMEKALRKAGKDVQFVKLKGEDHWLSQSKTRLEALEAIDAFVNQTIGGR